MSYWSSLVILSPSRIAWQVFRLHVDGTFMVAIVESQWSDIVKSSFTTVDTKPMKETTFDSNDAALT